MDKEYLNALSTKDEVLDYANTLGITTLVKSRSLKNLKSDLQIKFHQSLADVVDAVNSVSTKPIEGEDVVSVIKNYEVIQVVPVSALEQYCKTIGIPAEAAQSIIGKTWLNVHGYSFKEGY